MPKLRPEDIPLTPEEEAAVNAGIMVLSAVLLGVVEGLTEFLPDACRPPGTWC